MFSANTEFEIESPEGWVDFDGIQEVHRDQRVAVSFSDGSTVECSDNHKFFDVYDNEVLSVDLSDDTIIKHKDGSVNVCDVDIEDTNVVLYDIVNSGPKHRFFHDGGIVSHNCSFLGSVGTLIPSKDLKRMHSKQPLNYVEGMKDEEYDVKVYAEYIEGRKYVAIADVGEGLGQDYSVCDIFDVTEYPYKIAAKYRNAEISPLIFPYTCVDLCQQYGNAPILMEVNNDVGGQATTILNQEIEYENVIMTSTDPNEGSGVRVGGRKSRPGIKTTKKTKRIGCANLKSLIERDLLMIEDLDTITELGQFIRVRDSYEADKGCHDDCVMPLVILGWLVKQPWFQDMFERTDVSKDMMNNLRDAEIDEVLPFGAVFDDTVEDDDEYDVWGSEELDEFDRSVDNVTVYEGSKSLEEWMAM